MQLSVVSPTYNEAGNVDSLVETLTSVLQGIDYEIVIADDDSPDLTWKRAADIGHRDSRVRVVRRTSNHGLARAVIHGFQEARGEVVACIDADLQHDPSILPAMLREIERGADLVVGSRYAEAGGTDGWSFVRRAQSWIATQLAQAFMGVKLHDPMSGFFMMRKIDFLTLQDRLQPQGFKILLEIIGNSRFESIAEVPYIFGPRKYGKSKLTSGVVFSYLRQLIRLSRRRPENLVPVPKLSSSS